MAGAKPCMGHPTRMKAVLTLAGQGLTTTEIARLISADTPDDPVTVAKVSRLLCAGRQRAPVSPITLRLGGASYDRLAREASKRGSRADHLARRLIETVLADNLIDAILDDGGDA